MRCTRPPSSDVVQEAHQRMKDRKALQSLNSKPLFHAWLLSGAASPAGGDVGGLAGVLFGCKGLKGFRFKLSCVQ